jgi:hypothetical protein
MKKLLIGLMVLLSSLSVVGCSSNKNEDIDGDTLEIKKIEQRKNSGSIIEDVYVTTNNIDTSKGQLIDLFNIVNEFKTSEQDKNTFTKVILEDSEGNRLGFAVELGDVETDIETEGLNSNSFELYYTEEDENTLKMNN